MKVKERAGKVAFVGKADLVESCGLNTFSHAEQLPKLEANSKHSFLSLFLAGGPKQLRRLEFFSRPTGPRNQCVSCHKATTGIIRRHSKHHQILYMNL